MGKRPTAALLLVTALAATAPATADPAPSASPGQAFAAYRRVVERSLERGDADARRFFESVQADDDRLVFYWHRGIDDLDADGAREVLLERWRVTMDLVGFGFSGDYRAQVLDGARGSTQWTYRNEFSGGFPVLALRISLGEGMPGLLFPKIDNQSAESPTYRLTFDAVMGSSGETVWTRAFTSTYNLATGGVAGTDAPTALQKFEPDGDETTELLVALTDYARAALPDRAVARSEVYVLDAADGSLRSLGEVGPDLVWFHSVQAGPDVDGLGGDDVVIAGNENSEDAYLEARSGIDGATIWRTPARIGWHTWAAPLPDMNADGSRDIIVGWDRPNTNERVFQVWDARKPRPLWKAEGVFPYLLGDADRDGTTDIGAFDFVHTRKRTGARFKAFSHGRLLYRTSHVGKVPECDGFCFSSGFYLNAGDIDGDGLRDTYVLVTMPTKGEPKTIEYAAAGADGSVLYRRRNLAPVLGSLGGTPAGDLLGFARAGRDVIRVTAYDGPTMRSLWTRSYRMTGARNLGPYGAYGGAVELDGGGRRELLLTVAGKRARTLVALDGGSGELLWQRPVTGGRRVEIQR
ncbi:MAG: hypothetical protein M3279_04440 [Actinomycetota bacterium]|nr:hypothetical protein [Actinomycetota bacterium]